MWIYWNCILKLNCKLFLNIQVVYSLLPLVHLISLLFEASSLLLPPLSLLCLTPLLLACPHWQKEFPADGTALLTALTHSEAVPPFQWSNAGFPTNLKSGLKSSAGLILTLYLNSVQFGNKCNLKEERGERLFSRQVKEKFPCIFAPQAHLKDGTSLAPGMLWGSDAIICNSCKPQTEELRDILNEIHTATVQV